MRIAVPGLVMWILGCVNVSLTVKVMRIRSRLLSFKKMKFLLRQDSDHCVSTASTAVNLGSTV